MAAACAGKPSCAASASAAGAIARNAAASARAIEMRLRNVSAVTPLVTRANPPVGSAAGTPIV